MIYEPLLDPLNEPPVLVVAKEAIGDPPIGCGAPVGDDVDGAGMSELREGFHDEASHVERVFECDSGRTCCLWGISRGTWGDPREVYFGAQRMRYSGGAT